MAAIDLESGASPPTLLLVAVDWKKLLLPLRFFTQSVFSVLYPLMMRHLR